MPSAKFSVSVDTQDVSRMITELLRKMENPEPFVRQVLKYVKAVTDMMFRGRRADTSAVRGVSWPKLAPSTIKQKLARRLAYPRRPLWATGDLWRSIKVLHRAKDGFVYGTTLRSMAGFPYPAIHNVGGWVAGRPPKREWLFLNEEDRQTILQMAISFLEERRAAL